MAHSIRQQQILALAAETGHVRVEELAERFAVSPQTIRRDLGELCDRRALERTHGGAVLPASAHNFAYAARRDFMREEKERIARACADRIPDGSALFMNIGTTTEAVARALTAHDDLMVITNNLNVATLLGPSDRVEVVVTGGVVRRSDLALVGEATIDFIRQFRVDLAVVGVSAIAPDGALLDYDYREVRVTQAIIRNARRVCLVADGSKFERNAPVRIGALREVDMLVTDRAPPDPVAAICHESEVEVVVA